jgi:Rieske Fe-S protein
MPSTRRTFVAGVAVSLALPVLGRVAAAADGDGWVATLAPADLADGGFSAKYTDQHFILARVGAKISALDTKCTHQGCAIKVRGTQIVCPCHGGRYDGQGRVLKGPPKRSLARHPLRLNAQGVIEVDAAHTVGEDDPKAVLEIAPPATGPASQPG